MGLLEIIRDDEVQAESSYAAPVAFSGAVSSKLMSPPDYPLWLCVAELAAGARIQWSADHGDEGIYVLGGEVSVGGQPAKPDGAIIIESGVVAAAEATRRSRIAHFGSWDTAQPADRSRDPADTSEHCVHVVGPKGWFVSGSRESVVARWFADSTCPTCQIALFDVASDHEGQKPGLQHTHTQDEIIYVMRGSMRLGAREIGPGTSLSIGGNTRYAQSAGPHGCVFLNYRRDVSEQQYFVRGQPADVLPETALSRGGVEIGDVVHVQAS